MLKTINQPTLWIALISAFMVSAGMHGRLSEPAKTADISTQTEVNLAHFFRYSGLSHIKRVHFTADKGITGIQAAIPACDGLLHAVVMPEGDEFLGLWLSRSEHVGNTITFVFDHQEYPDFPAMTFWLTGISNALKSRFSHQQTATQPVIALSYPATCHHIEMLPWQHFQP